MHLPDRPIYPIHLNQSTMAPSEPSHYVTLISNDGFEFIVRRDAACVAGTIRKMLDPQSKCAFFPANFVLEEVLCQYSVPLSFDNEVNFRVSLGGEIQ